MAGVRSLNSTLTSDTIDQAEDTLSHFVKTQRVFDFFNKNKIFTTFTLEDFFSQTENRKCLKISKTRQLKHNLCTTTLRS